MTFALRCVLVVGFSVSFCARLGAAALEDFYGTWEVVGQQCASSREQTEGDWFSIGPGTIAYGAGASCSDVVMKPHGDSLGITAHCTFEEAESSTPMAEQLALNGGNLVRTLPEGREQQYERCDLPEDGLSEHAPADDRVRCSPKDNTARILREPSPNALHPSWSDGFLGTSFTIAVTRRLKAVSGNYLEGDLYTPRGNLTERGVFAVASEWDCGSP